MNLGPGLNLLNLGRTKLLHTPQDMKYEDFFPCVVFDIFMPIYTRIFLLQVNEICDFILPESSEHKTAH